MEDLRTWAISGVNREVSIPYIPYLEHLGSGATGYNDHDISWLTMNNGG